MIRRLLCCSHARLDPKLDLFLHPSADLGDWALILCRLSSEACHSSLCRLIISLMTYDSIGFIILDLSCDFFCIYMLRLLLRATWSNSFILA